MSGFKKGDRVAARIYGGWCCATVEGFTPDNRVKVRHKDGQLHYRAQGALLPPELLISLAEEALGKPEAPEPDYVYITSYGTGTTYTVGEAVEVFCRSPSGSVLTVDGYTLAPDWYTEEAPF